MKNIKLNIILILFVFTSSFLYGIDKLNTAKKNSQHAIEFLKPKKIQLLRQIDARKLIIENSCSIISLPIDSIISYISIDFKFFNICDIRKNFYTELLANFKNNSNKSFFFVEKGFRKFHDTNELLYIDSTEYPKQFNILNHYKTNTYKVGAEFGFNLLTDTNSNIKLNNYPGRIIGRLLNNGVGTIFNKLTGNYEEYVYLQEEIAEISRYRLLFQSYIPFYEIQLMLDNVDPNNECGEQIKNFYSPKLDYGK